MSRHSWTEAEVTALVARYPHEITRAIADDLGIPLDKVYKKAAHLGLEKSAAFRASDLSGRLQAARAKTDPRIVRTQFKKGQPPHNKGLRRPGWHRGRMRETQFKAGEKPHTWQPVGTEVVRDGYVWVKVRDDRRPTYKNWMSKHQHVWEQAHGPVPTGDIVRFKDGNRANLALDNLECVSRAEHAATKGLHALPPEVVKIHQLRGAIARQINKRQPPVRPRRGRPPKAQRALA